MVASRDERESLQRSVRKLLAVAVKFVQREQGRRRKHKLKAVSPASLPQLLFILHLRSLANF